jgi:photosystem II stability/assembly factor-like uncharacterized protein
MGTTPEPRRTIALLSVLLLSQGANAVAHAAPEPSSVEHALEAPLAATSLLTDAASVQGHIVVVGERGHALFSDDDGATWRQAEVESRALLTGIHMHDAEHGWAVGHDETILRTVDGGVTWQRVRSDPEAERPLLDVWFADAERGFAVGAYGAFFATADGGETWQERPISDDDFHLNEIAAADDGTLYLAAEAGALYRSDDAGESWRMLPSPYDGSFFGVEPLADGALLAFGLRGNLFRSEDRGETWVPIDTGTLATLMAAAEPSAGVVVVAGLAGAVLTSSDGGRTFELRELGSRLATVEALAHEGEVLLLGEGGVRRLADAR